LIYSRLDGIQDLKRREVLYAIKHPYSTEQLEHQRYLADVHQLTKPQIKNRTLIVYTNLAAYYHKRANMDHYQEKDSICICEKEDLLAGLYEFKIHISAGVSFRKKIKLNSFFIVQAFCLYLVTYVDSR
jgi:hypothetical protein